jgi:uncharacterized metal-binding protein YceD (DUF177 family)
MTQAPEFSRPLRLDALGTAPLAQALKADAAECAALARRFGLLTIGRLDAEVEAVRNADIIEVVGRIRAEVEQACVATGAPLPVVVDTPFAVRFVPEAQVEAIESEELELSSADCDVVPYEGGAVDVGEAVAESLVLALDPFPRSPDADAVLRAAGVKSEEEAGPFAALAALKDKLAKK